MALIVKIFINDEEIISTHAVRQEKLGHDGQVSSYKQDTGDFIQHKYSNGAIPLAIEMLQNIERLT